MKISMIYFLYDQIFHLKWEYCNQEKKKRKKKLLAITSNHSNGFVNENAKRKMSGKCYLGCVQNEDEEQSCTA